MSGFTHSKAVRKAVQILVGITGPSGSGKTLSGIRVAEGMRRVTGGKVFILDTENGRALHYADDYEFDHVPFEPPFSPLRYVEGIDYCVAQGAKVLIIDNLSHEHEGVGGVLEWHARELEAMGGKNSQTFAAWVKPKQARARLIQALLRVPIHVILLFRAKEKLKIERGKDPQPLGWQAISGDEFIYECTLHALLRPGSDGRWTLKEAAEYDSERANIKIPAQFRDFFSKPRQFDEATGEFMARWAAGTPAEPHPLVARLSACRDDDTLAALKAEAKTAWASLTAADRASVAAAVKEAEAHQAAAQAPQLTPEPATETQGWTAADNEAVDREIVQQEAFL